MGINRYLIIDILFLLLFIYYGYRYRYLTPSFETKTAGITTPRCKKNRKNWRMGHDFGGLLCFGYAALFAVLLGIKNMYVGYGTWMDVTMLVLGILLCVSVPVLVELKLKRDGSDEVEKDERDIGGPGLRDAKAANRKTGGGKRSKNQKKR